MTSSARRSLRRQLQPPHQPVDVSRDATTGADLDTWPPSSIASNSSSSSGSISHAGIDRDRIADAVGFHIGDTNGGTFVDLDSDDEFLTAGGVGTAATSEFLRRHWQRVPQQQQQQAQLKEQQLRDLARLQKLEIRRLECALQEATSSNFELATILAKREDELKRARNELLLREDWCRQLAKEAEQESARCGRLLRRCHQLEDSLSSRGEQWHFVVQPQHQQHQQQQQQEPPPPPLPPRRFPSSSCCHSAGSQTPPTRLRNQQPQQQQPQPQPASVSKSAKKLSAARQLLTGRYSFKLKKRRSSLSNTAATATAAANVWCLESEV
ncbi:hypothetical protein BOX15_Mlig020579g3 [Macrostomum lignano]|uniref:Uncharacterized protein n=1 Tax=Macrostomum lignano TaxID=282301 RepID=A0A267FNG5_9PLAT|nr:hypothetical protein BOX15_Mlig020579g3 [Macrostomum lignano]